MVRAKVSYKGYIRAPTGSKRRISNVVGSSSSGYMRSGSSSSGRRRLGKNRRTGGFLGIEKKFYDTSFSAAAMSAATDATGGEYDPVTALCLNVPAVGDGEQNRDGKQIIGKYIEIKGRLNLPVAANQTAAPEQSQAMVAIVLDTQSNGAQAQSESVFKNLGATANLAPLSLRNLEYAKRFRILKQELFIFPAPQMSYDGTNIEVGGQSRDFTWYIPLGNMQINFNSGTTSAISALNDKSIHVMGYTSNAAVTIAYNARFRFIG